MTHLSQSLMVNAFAPICRSNSCRVRVRRAQIMENTAPRTRRAKFASALPPHSNQDHSLLFNIMTDATGASL
jgi:hypothetical protein